MDHSAHQLKDSAVSNGSALESISFASKIGPNQGGEGRAQSVGKVARARGVGKSRKRYKCVIGGSLAACRCCVSHCYLPAMLSPLRFTAC